MTINADQLARLRHAIRGPHRAAVLLAVAGTLLALVRWRWLPEMPRALPVALIAAALGLYAVGSIRRIRWLIGRR